MGTHAERVAIKDHVSREDQDAFALASHQKAIAAMDAGRFDAELAPVTIRDAKGRETVVDRGRGPAPRLDRRGARPPQAGLRPARRRGPRRRDRPGPSRPATPRASPTARRPRSSPASGPSSGYGLKPLARIVGYAQAEVAPKWLFLAPVQGVRRLLDRIELPIEAFDLIEINEAFAAQALADGRELGFDWDKVNVNGGAIALGHPIGASGARIVATLLHELARREGRYGLATLCLGGGGSVAMAFERIAPHDRHDRADRRRDPDVRPLHRRGVVRFRRPARRSRAATRPTRATSSGRFQQGTKADVAQADQGRRDGLPDVAPHAGPEARRDPVRVRRAHGRAQGATGPRDDPRDGQGPRGGARRRPGRHRHRLPDGRRGPPDGRRDGPVRAPRQVGDERPPAARHRRDHHALELPDGHPVLEDDAGAGHRQYRRVQAVERHAALRDAARRAHARGGLPGRCREPRHGRRRRGRRRDRR